VSTPRRLPHVLTRADLAGLLASSYARSSSVDEELARERLEQALAAPGPLLGDLYEAIATAMAAERGPRQTEDEQLDRMGKHIPRRLRRPRPAPESASIAAIFVQVDLALGLAPERMQAMLDSEKGRSLRTQGLAELAAHLTSELLRS
jgi:hypothetical protein